MDGDPAIDHTSEQNEEGEEYFGGKWSKRRYGGGRMWTRSRKKSREATLQGRVEGSR